jgi:predicted histone-like DNA-binding protein
MAVKLTPIGKTSPATGRKGEKKYYAQVLSSGTDTMEHIIQRIEKSSTASSADVKLVLRALVDTMKVSFAEGRIVQLEDLGSFRLSVSSDPVKEPGNISRHNVKQVRVIFKPDKELKRWLKRVKFKKS